MLTSVFITVEKESSRYGGLIRMGFAVDSALAGLCISRRDLDFDFKRDAMIEAALQKGYVTEQADGSFAVRVPDRDRLSYALLLARLDKQVMALAVDEATNDVASMRNFIALSDEQPTFYFDGPINPAFDAAGEQVRPVVHLYLPEDSEDRANHSEALLWSFKAADLHLERLDHQSPDDPDMAWICRTSAAPAASDVPLIHASVDALVSAAHAAGMSPAAFMLDGLERVRAS